MDQADVASLGASVLGMPGCSTHHADDRCRADSRPGDSVRDARAPRSPTPSNACCTPKPETSRARLLTAFATPGGLVRTRLWRGANEVGRRPARARRRRPTSSPTTPPASASRVRGREGAATKYGRLLLWTIASCFLGWIGVLLAELATEGRETKSPGLSGDTHARHRDRSRRLVRRVRRARLAVVARGRTRTSLPGEVRAARLPGSPPPRRSDTRRREAAAAAAELVATAAAATAARRCAPRSTTGVTSFSSTDVVLRRGSGCRKRVPGSIRDRRSRRRGAGTPSRGRRWYRRSPPPRGRGLAPFTLFSVDLEANTTLVVAGVGNARAVGRESRGSAPAPGRVRGRAPRRPTPAPAPVAARAALGTSSWSRSSPCCGAPGSWCGWWTVCRARRRRSARGCTLPRGRSPRARCRSRCSLFRFVPRFPSVYLASAATAYALFSVSYESLFYLRLLRRAGLRGAPRGSARARARHVQNPGSRAADALGGGFARGKPKIRDPFSEGGVPPPGPTHPRGSGSGERARARAPPRAARSRRLLARRRAAEPSAPPDSGDDSAPASAGTAGTYRPVRC